MAARPSDPRLPSSTGGTQRWGATCDPVVRNPGSAPGAPPLIDLTRLELGASLSRSGQDDGDDRVVVRRVLSRGGRPR